MTSVENMLEPRTSVEVSALLVQLPWLSKSAALLLLCPAFPAALAPPALLIRPAGPASLATQRGTSRIKGGLVMQQLHQCDLCVQRQQDDKVLQMWFGTF